MQKSVFYPQKLNAQLCTVIKYLIVDRVRSVIGCHPCQGNAKFAEICAGCDMSGAPAEHDKAFGSAELSGWYVWIRSGF